VILVDTSGWVEYLRATGSALHMRVRGLLAEDAELATTDVVLMELLAGARNDRERHDLRRMLYGRCSFLATEGPTDYERAADLYRLCRGNGETIRKLTDCLIAVVAMRADSELLHWDADFDAIARHAPLRVASP
jgi:predicted nucleic acid-binding protein